MTRSQIQSPTKRTHWYALVAGLVALCTLLNLLPLGDIRYVHRVRTILSPERVHVLQMAIGDARQPGLQLLSIDRVTTSVGGSESSIITDDRLRNRVLANVVCVSSGRRSSQELLNYLDERSIPKLSSTEIADLERASRSLAWNRRATQHLLDQIAKESERDEHRASKESAEIAPIGARISSVSLQRPVNDDGRSREILSQWIASQDEAYVKLTEQLRAAHLHLRGFLAFSSPPIIRPVLSAAQNRSLIIALVTGAATVCLTALLLRPTDASMLPAAGNETLKSTVTIAQPVETRPSSNWQALRVARELEKSGIVYLGSLRSLSSSTASESEFRAKSKFADRFMAAGLHCLEWALLLWILAISMRFAFDASWRALASELPLAALGRVVLGVA